MHVLTLMYVCHYLATWLFLDETLVRHKEVATADSQVITGDHPAESNKSSFANDSGIGLGQQETFDPAAVSTGYNSGNEYQEAMKMKDNPLLGDVDSKSDSETELVTPETESKKRCLGIFSIVKLAHLILRRVTDCVEGYVSCVLWIFDCTKCKPDNFKRKSSGSSQPLSDGVCRVLRLMMDRKVLISVLIYGFIAFLENVVSEVSSFQNSASFSSKC